MKRNINEYIDSKIINNEIIDESVLSWLKSFIKKIKANQNKLIQNGKVKMLRMRQNQVKIQKQAVSLLELAKDKEAMDDWSNPKIGFPESAMIAKNPKKYLDQTTGEGENEKKSNPLVHTFYYQGKNTYYAGVLIYEKDITYIENYTHLISIETNLVVDNPGDIQKLMLNQFKEMRNSSIPSFEGFTAKLDKLPPKIKANMIKLGFKKDDENDIYLLKK